MHKTCNIFRHRLNSKVTFTLLFNRFENQDRHTVHTHLLVWLKEAANIYVDHIRASIPKNNTFLTYLVSLLYTFWNSGKLLFRNVKQISLSYIEKEKLILSRFNIQRYDLDQLLLKRHNR